MRKQRENDAWRHCSGAKVDLKAPSEAGLRVYWSYRPRSQRGVVLVLVLWAGALLSVIAVGLAFGVRTDRVAITNAGARLQAEVMAESAVNRALLDLIGSDRPIAWRPDGRVYEMPFEGGLLRASIHAETGKIDLNAAPEQLLAGLVSTVHERLGDAPVSAASLTAAILDWRDADSLTRPFGAEDPEYRAAGRDRGAGNRAFLSIDELGQVLGMSERVFKQIRPLVTVHTRSPKIDPITAPKLALLAASDLESAQIAAFLSERNRLLALEPVIRGQNVGSLLDMLKGSERHFALANARIFTILAEGRTSDGVAAFRQAVVEVTPGSARPYSVLAWADEPLPVHAMLEY